ncbi:MAG: hypothetical protein L6435_02485 [Anaerolineae bacterium]|nr:hypothetical protein [Anaerolineae bacterium]
MADHIVYRAIISVVESGQLKEPFSGADIRHACPELCDATCNTFPHKHSLGNPGGTSELFERVSPGRFRLLRPFRYGL